jgi:DNA helicase II / ATP-dependent DNA helicase PcrA
MIPQKHPLDSVKTPKFKDSLITPDDAPTYCEAMITHAVRGGIPVDVPGLRASTRVYAEYQQRLRESNAADFGDLLLWPTRAMQQDETYYQRWAERFDAVLADEFQDVNVAQFTWLRLLGELHGQIFCVGDDDQSVYSWRGADVSFIRKFPRNLPGASVFRLEENFRSTGHILAVANAVIAQDPARLGKTLYTRKPDGNPVEIIAFRNAGAESLGIVVEIERRHAEGVLWDDMAILYRNNALSRGFEEPLIHRRVPYALIGDVAFYSRAEIKDALALLRLATAPDDAQSDEAFRRVINTPARGFGVKTMDILEIEAAWRRVPLLVALETAPLPPKARSAGLAFVDAIRGIGHDPEATMADQLSLLLDVTGYRTMLRSSRDETIEERLENLHELIGLAGGFHTAHALLDHAALSTGGPDDDKTDVVRLMTLHRAKGLEFPHVFLPAWEAGVFPPSYGDAAEERRLAYVALTRGMRRVTISFCGFRRGPAGPSPFIDDIPSQHCSFGWLHQQAPAAQRPRRRTDRLDAAELLQRF